MGRDTREVFEVVRRRQEVAWVRCHESVVFPDETGEHLPEHTDGQWCPAVQPKSLNKYAIWVWVSGEGRKGHLSVDTRGPGDDRGDLCRVTA